MKLDIRKPGVLRPWYVLGESTVIDTVTIRLPQHGHTSDRSNDLVEIYTETCNEEWHTDESDQEIWKISHALDGLLENWLEKKRVYVVLTINTERSFLGRTKSM